ncbi:MAG: exodeoxyribonuclease V subunit RecD [Sodalis sp. Ffu]|nr:MAG: exodeoxyribonuclease V subunit RecD [Sodalis sp. Ffu]
MERIIAQAQMLRLWRPLDIQFSRMLAAPSQLAIMLASACLSADAGAGHVCLPLALLTPARLFDGRYPNLARQAWQRAGRPSLDDWQRLLLTSTAVSDGSRPTPLVLDNQRLYLHRMWQHECMVAQFFCQTRRLLGSKEKRITEVLNYLFPSNNKEIDWQKIAVAIAITHPVVIISGGPGTGKTSTVTKLLAALLLLSKGARLSVIMAAPTGKAAARLSESLGPLVQYTELIDSQKQLPQKAITLHRLLRAQPNSQRLGYHRTNPLHVDILIIDEASMIDLPMMANIIEALPPQAQVIFLGDHHQLSSVAPGAILGDICQFAKTGYSDPRRQELDRLTGYKLPVSTNSSNSIADSLCLLRQSYRFDNHSGIGQLANAINAGDRDGALALLNTGISKDLNYTSLQKKKDYQQMISDCVAGYRDYLQRTSNKENPIAILNAFNHYRILCALREGPFGIDGLNNHIEQALSQAGLIQPTSNRNYIGQPVMLLRNEPTLELSNGDIGILLPAAQQLLRAHFMLPHGTIRTVPLSRLPEYETAFAMTVHKSQGSEFSHIALVLPNQPSLPILTRELLYTAVTRARHRLSLYATHSVITQAITTTTKRRSGLVDRLMTTNTR